MVGIRVRGFSLSQYERLFGLFWALTLLSQFSTHIYVAGAANRFKQCEELKHTSQNVEVKCRNETGSIPICIYKCRTYYIPYENPEKLEREIRCEAGGSWTGLPAFKTFACKEDCGRRLTTPKALIVHGSATNSSLWPWHAALFRRAPGTGTADSAWIFICGGSLIRNAVILTAAHCVTSLDKEVVSADLFRVVLGETGSNFTAIRNSPNAQVFEVRRIYVSESFDPKKEFQADIALMHLSGGDVRFSHRVLPVCLPNEYALDINAVKPGRFGDVVGFGIDETGTVSKVLKHVQLAVAAQSECFNGLKRVLSESQFCAGNKREGEDWETVCNGDSGGGLVFPSSVLQRYFIHGIVSSGDSVRIKDVCQNYAVFTRVFQFIFWIRDVLEQINGEQIRELKSRSKYPYVQIGTETIHGQFSAIPREWDNLITSVQLLHYDIPPAILFDSLEHNRGLELLNLTQVKFKGTLGGRRAVLPNLKTFVMDQPEPDCGVGTGEPADSLYCTDKDPTRLSKTYIKSLLFFDKYETAWPMREITTLGTNIELTLHTSKVLLIDFQQRKMVLQVPFCSEVLEYLSIDMDLRLLALRNCVVDLGALIGHPTATTGTLKSLRSLVLDSVTVKGELGSLIGVTNSLEDLRITEGVGSEGAKEAELDDTDPGIELTDPNNAERTCIHLSSLPPSLKYLALTQVRLQLSSSSPLLFRSPIIFPGAQSEPFSRKEEKPRSPLPNLETLFCNSCILDPEVLNQFPYLFRRAKRLVFFGEQALDVPQLVRSLPNLELLIFGDIGGDPEFGGSSGFVGLEKFPTEGQPRATEFVVYKKEGQWVRASLKRRAELLSFLYSGLGEFWTSFEDYETNARLSSFEKAAYNSGKYQFSSTGDQFQRLPRIRSAISTNLKSIEIRKAEVIPNELLDSLTSAYELQSLVLEKVRLLGYFVNFVELPNLHTYRLSALSNPDYRFDQTSTKYGAEFFVPFSRTPAGASTSGTKRFQYFRNTVLSPRMRAVDITFDDCKLLSIDYLAGRLVYTPKMASDILPVLHTTNLSSLALRLSASEVNELSLPPGLADLNLRCKSEYEWHWNCSSVASRLLRRLSGLTELRLSFHHIYQEHDALFRTNGLRLSDLSRSSSRLEFLGLEEAHLEYSARIRLPRLRAVFFETCTFADELVQNFLAVFPVHTVGILSYGYDKYGEALKRNYTRDIETLLLKVLRSERVQRVLGSLGSTEERTDFSAFGGETKQSPTAAQIGRILLGAGVEGGRTDGFILERRNGKWASVLGSRKEEFSREVNRLRGDYMFGSGACINRNFAF